MGATQISYRKIVCLIALFIVILGTNVFAIQPVSSTTPLGAPCPIPPGSTDRPVISYQYRPGFRVPTFSWTTACPSISGFRMEWAFWKAPNDASAGNAWLGKEHQNAPADPSDPEYSWINLSLQNLDFGGGAGWQSTQIPLQTIPSSAPGTPQLFDNGSGRMSVRWTGPLNYGGEQPTFIVTTVPESAGCQTSEYQCTISNLELDRDYSVSVAAVNSVGTSPQSTTSQERLEGPRVKAPRAVGVRKVGPLFVVRWKAPIGPPTSEKITYVVTSSPSQYTCRTNKTTCNFEAGSPGKEYSFKVTSWRAGRKATSRQSPFVSTPLPPRPVTSISPPESFKPEAVIS